MQNESRKGEYTSPKGAAAILRVSVTHIYNLLKDGLLPFVQAGKRMKRIAWKDLDAFIARYTVRALDPEDTPAEAGTTRNSLQGSSVS